ncbi:MAG: tetratricopeptide repeat protein, partial [Rhodospirillales bacterium]
ILIHAEQGIGDTLQFTRYVALIKKTGASVIVECQPEVANLVSCMEGVRAVVRSGEPFLKFNVQIPLLSFPLIFGTNVDTIPVSSYLAPPIKPTIKINESKKKRVGLVWARSATYNNDRHRSIPLETLVPFFDTVEYEFFSLQVGSKREDIQRLGLSEKLRTYPQV